MSVAGLISKMKRFDKNAEVIFDRDEPIGRATDLVMPRRGWFGGKRSAFPAEAPNNINLVARSGRETQTQALS